MHRTEAGTLAVLHNGDWSGKAELRLENDEGQRVFFIETTGVHLLQLARAIMEHPGALHALSRSES